MSELHVVPLGRDVVEAWAGLFARAHVACFCRWWHFSGTKNDWLGRCAAHPEANRAEAERAAREGSPEAGGLLAMRGELAVGWMKIAPREALPKLRGLPVYRARLAEDEPGVWSVGCVLVDPRERRRGVARALLAAAPDFARERGARVLEGYPRRAPESQHGPLHDEEAWMGPEGLFATMGFVAMDDEAYPRYRRVL